MHLYMYFSEPGVGNFSWGGGGNPRAPLYETLGCQNAEPLQTLKLTEGEKEIITRGRCTIISWKVDTN